MKEQVVNFSDAKDKAIVLANVRLLQGPHRITIVKHRPRRSDRQNRFYWPVFVQSFGDFLRGQGDTITDEQVHELFKFKFLRKTAMNTATGEVIGDYTQSTTTLSVGEFNQYLDKIAEWLGGFGWQLPAPEMYHEKELEHAA